MPEDRAVAVGSAASSGIQADPKACALTALLRDPAHDLEGFLRTAGFDASGPFCAVSVPGDAGDLRAAVREGLERRGAVVAVDTAGSSLLLQGPSADRLLEVAVELLRGAPAGLGLWASGPQGARRTLEQALSAGELASRTGRLVRFEQAWPLLLLLRGEDELHDHLAPAMDFARRKPELAKTVRTFAASGFSITKTGRAMHLTPNAVVYRLGRWECGTGWNPRSYEGLTYSLASLELLALEDARNA